MLVAALVLASTVYAADEAKPNPSDPRYTLVYEGTTPSLGTGEKGEMRIQIRAAKGFKVNAKAPLKIKLKATGLSLEKKQFGHADAEDPQASSPKFRTPFTATQSGLQKITGTAMFFICDPSVCERRTEDVEISVEVKERPKS